MNGYELTVKLRRARRRHRLSAPTQALYYELVAICNEEEWPDEFKCSNDELCTALQITEKSLIAYRQELIQSGLIFYQSGKSKKKIGSYSFIKDFPNGCKIYSQSGSQSDSQPGENPSDLIKTKRESKGKESIYTPPVGDKLNERIEQLKKFYAGQVEENKDEPLIGQYRAMAYHLFGKNESKRVYRNILSMLNQVTFPEFKTMERVSAETGISTVEIFDEMENYAGLPKKNLSVAGTATNWMRRNYKRQKVA